MQQEMTTMQPQGDFQQLNAGPMAGNPDFGLHGQAPLFTGAALADPGMAGGQLMSQDLKMPGDDLQEYLRDTREPEHSTNTWSIMIIGCIAAFLTFLSLILSEWRSNHVGVVGYAQRRGWGLTHVVGARAQSHYQIMQFTCRAYGGLSVGGICNSPICVWYKLKCQIYIQLMWVSYTSFVFILLSMLIHGICLYWTYKLTRRMIRWAATWFWCALGLQAGAIVFYIIMTEDLFESMHEKAIYPVPPISASFVMACISAFCQLICAILETLQMKAWPERHDDDSDDEDDSEDEFGVMDIMKEIKNAEKAEREGYVLEHDYQQGAYAGAPHVPTQYGGAPPSTAWGQTQISTEPAGHDSFVASRVAPVVAGSPATGPDSVPENPPVMAAGEVNPAEASLTRSDTMGIPKPGNI